MAYSISPFHSISLETQMSKRIRDVFFPVGQLLFVIVYSMRWSCRKMYHFLHPFVFTATCWYTKIWSWGDLSAKKPNHNQFNHYWRLSFFVSSPLFCLVLWYCPACLRNICWAILKNWPWFCRWSRWYSTSAFKPLKNLSNLQ